MFIGLILLIALWSIVSYIVYLKLKLPRIQWLEKVGYEIRTYDSYITAETEVTGSIQVAGYNPPLSTPLFLRREILIQLTITPLWAL
jgi:hypothetical protein